MLNDFHMMNKFAEVVKDANIKNMLSHARIQYHKLSRFQKLSPPFVDFYFAYKSVTRASI